MKNKHSDKPAEKVQCSICNHWIKKSAIKLHIKNHDDKGTKCEVCGKHLSSLSITTHMKLVHSEPRFKCTQCDKAFSRHQKLIEHVAVAHTREFLYQCRVPECAKQFRAQASWKTHEKKNHPLEYEKIFKPYYKRDPNEPVLNVEEALRKLREETNEVVEEFFVEGFE